MRGASSWWLPLATLIVGLGVGYLVWGGGEATTARTELVSSSDSGGVAPASPGLLEAPGLSSAGGAQPLRDLLHAVPVPQAERGDGVIEGTIKDADGNAVMGARVLLDAQPDRSQFYPKDRPEDPEKAILVTLRGQMALFRWQQAYHQETTTDASGHYRFDGVTDHKHRIVPKSPGWRFRPGDWRAAREAKPGATVDFVATPRSRVRIEVTGAEVPDELTVQFKSGGITRGARWRKADPLVDVEPGTYEMTVQGGEHREFQGGPVPVSVQAGAGTQTVHVALEVRPVLRLKLDFPPDEAMAIQACLAPWSGADLPSDAVLRSRGTTHRFFWRQQAGLPGRTDAWQVTDLEPGPHVVGLARGYQGPMFHKEVIDVSGGVQEHTIRVPPLDPSEYMIVAVLAPDGKPIDRASINLAFRSEQMNSSSGSVTAHRRDGRLLVLSRLQGVPPGAKGRYTLTARVPGMGSKSVEYVPGQTRDLEIRFAEPGLLHVHVKGLRGSPYDGRVTVSLQTTDQLNGWGVKELDADGGATLAGVQPGNYLLAVNVRGGNHSMSTVETVPVSVVEGKNDQTVSLPALYRSG